jgi:hypothetical protein
MYIPTGPTSMRAETHTLGNIGGVDGGPQLENIVMASVWTRDTATGAASTPTQLFYTPRTRAAAVAVEGMASVIAWRGILDEPRQQRPAHAGPYPTDALRGYAEIALRGRDAAGERADRFIVPLDQMSGVVREVVDGVRHAVGVVAAEGNEVIS